MRNFFTVLVVAGLFLCPCGACSAENVDLKFDNRQWELAFSDATESQSIQEYVLVGETIDNWTELVTVQIFYGLQTQTTCEQYMEKMMEMLKNVCPTTAATVISKGENEILFSWEIKDCPGQENQFEIDRVLAGKEALYILHYVTKKPIASSGKRDEWVKALSSAKLTD